jgi:hypothetical protein
VVAILRHLSRRSRARFDAAEKLTRACPQRDDRLAILRCPVEGEGTASLSGQAAILVRAIRPDDEPLLHDMIAHPRHDHASESACRG